MGEAGESAEVVDERLWNEDDQEAPKDGTDKDKYEKGSTVQTGLEDELEFRGAEEGDAQEKPSKPEEKEGAAEAAPEDKGKDKRNAPAKEDAGDEGPVNEKGEDDVEEAHGFKPEGPPDADADMADAPADEEPLELPEDFGLPGEDGGDGDEDHDADADDIGMEPEGAAEPDAGAEDGAQEALLEAMEREGDEADADTGEGEVPPVGADDRAAAAADDLNQGQQSAAALGRGGAGARETPPPLDTQAEANAPTVAPSAGGTAATASAATPAAMDDGTALEQDMDAAADADAIPPASSGGGGGGGGGGSGEATGGAAGATAQTDQRLPGNAPAARRMLSEPNPYRNLGDALQRWRERLSVRTLPLCALAFCLSSGLRGAPPARGSRRMSNHFYYQTL
jgi:midasin